MTPTEPITNWGSRPPAGNFDSLYPASDAKIHTILVADDEAPIRDNITRMLRIEGYKVLTATNGREALALAREHLPDLIIADSMMPEMDGAALLQALRDAPLTASLPFVFLTARAEQSDIRAGMNLGADDYVTKPFMRNELLGTVRTRLQRASGERRKLEQLAQQARRLTYFDALTGLPNRTLLKERLQQALTVSSRSGCCGALLFIDLDHFKNLNDTLGHDQGDRLLLQVAQRLLRSGRETNTVAHLGGDKFAVLLEDLSMNLQEASAQAGFVGEKIRILLSDPYRLDERSYVSTPSIGITLFDHGKGACETLLQQAELAMYQSKSAGRNALSFFDSKLQALVSARVAMEEDLRQALQEDQFVLHYQPQVSHDVVIGAEALVRWQHPQRGMVSPAEFIPVAEESGLILPLGLWVLETACRQLAAWASRPEMAPLTIAVNVSAHQFHQSDFVDQVLAVLVRTGANPQRLKLELTESMLVTNIEDVIAKMSALKATGISFSLDDFGTGYSSLAYLTRLPLAQLKIDRSFVMNIEGSDNAAVICAAIVSLAHSLKLKVVAEGVETEAQLYFLNTVHRCDVIQGYLHSRPLPLGDFEAFVEHGLPRSG